MDWILGWNYMSRPQQAHTLAAGLLYQEAPTPVKLISHLAVLRQDVDFHLLTRKMEALNTFQGQIAEKFENMANITKNGNKAWSLQTLPGSTATSSWDHAEHQLCSNLANAWQHAAKAKKTSYRKSCKPSNISKTGMSTKSWLETPEKGRDLSFPSYRVCSRAFCRWRPA